MHGLANLKKRHSIVEETRSHLLCEILNKDFVKYSAKTNSSFPRFLVMQIYYFVTILSLFLLFFFCEEILISMDTFNRNVFYINSKFPIVAEFAIFSMQTILNT